jgi:hypothetical protein
MLHHGRTTSGLGRCVNGRHPVPQVIADLSHHVIELRVEPIVADSAFDIVDEWGVQSFPASDPPANW